MTIQHPLVRLSVSLLAIAFVAGEPVQAQSYASTTCGEAIRIAEKGRPEHKLDWALDVLHRCGAEGATAAARAFTSLRTETDTAVLDSLTYPLLAWRDPALLDATTALVSDKGASKESRVFAVRYLYSLVVPGTTAGYSDLAGEPPGKCSGSATTTAGITESRAVAVGYIGHLRAMGAAVYADSGNPIQVRRAVACLANIPANYEAPPPSKY